MTDHDHEDGPPLTPPPAAYREEPTNPEASPAALRASSAPPPPPADYFERALLDLKAIHREQMGAFAELHDPDSRLNKNIELVLFEVRGVRRDLAGISVRTGKLEERMDDVEREVARERSARARAEAHAQTLEAKLDAAIAAGIVRAPVG